MSSKYQQSIIISAVSTLLKKRDMLAYRFQFTVRFIRKITPQTKLRDTNNI